MFLNLCEKNGENSRRCRCTTEFQSDVPYFRQTDVIYISNSKHFHLN